ncbi:hypothetical protein H5410_014065, partial [Solanum commersonii]
MGHREPVLGIERNHNFISVIPFRLKRIFLKSFYHATKKISGIYDFKIEEIFFSYPQIYLTAILFNPRYKEYGAKALVECIYQNLDIQPDEEPDLVTCQNSIKLLAKEIYDKYCSLNNVENPQMSMPQVGVHGRMKHKLGLDSSN